MERVLVGRDMGYLKEWWTRLQASGEPWVVRHCANEQEAVPVFLHCDEAKYVNHGEKTPTC